MKAWFKRLRVRIGSLISGWDIEKMQNRVDELLSPQITRAHIEAGKIDVAIESEFFMRRMGEILLAMLDTVKAKNYTETVLEPASSEARSDLVARFGTAGLVVTVQREGHITPHQARVKAEELARIGYEFSLCAAAVEQDGNTDEYMEEFERLGSEFQRAYAAYSVEVLGKSVTSARMGQMVGAKDCLGCRNCNRDEGGRISASETCLSRCVFEPIEGTE